jgi:hypothetical protein
MGPARVIGCGPATCDGLGSPAWRSPGSPLGREWVAAAVDAPPTIAAPAPLTDCPVQFGNNDIYDGTYLDPTP